MGKLGKFTNLIDNHQRVIKLGMLLLFSALVMIYGAVKLFFKMDFAVISGRRFALGYTVICLLWVAGTVLLYRFIYKKPLPLERIAFIAVLVFGAFNIVLFPPITVPDEMIHYCSAYRMADYYLFKSPLFSEAGLTMFTQDGVLMRNSDIALMGISGNLVSENAYYTVISNFEWLSSDSTYNVFPSMVAFSNAPCGYFVSGLGIAIGRVLNLGAIPVFYLGRITNAIFFAFLVYISVKITPIFKEALFVLALMPMTIHVAASYSYDSIIIGIAMLFFALVMKARCQEKVLSKRHIILLFALSWILAPCKLVYVPMLFLVLLIPAKNIPSKHPQLIKCLMIGLGLVSLLVTQFPQYTQYVQSEPIDSFTGEGINYSLSWMICNPFDAINVFTMTIVNYVDYYVVTMTGALLGWLQISVPQLIGLSFLMMMVIASMRKTNDIHSFRFYEKIWCSILIVGGCLLVLLSMLLAWTPFGSQNILGVQGRYFIPFIPLSFILVRNSQVTLPETFFRRLPFLACYIGFLSVAISYLRILGVI